MHSESTKSTARSAGSRRRIGVWALTLTGLVVGLATGAQAADSRQEPPSSLKPADRAGRVEITHERRQVDSCQLVEEDGDKVCRPKAMQPELSDTKVVLKPLGASGKVVPGEKRQKQTVEFSKSKGRQAKMVTLAPGVWELFWAEGGAAAKDRFRVEPGDSFHIGLESFKGVCEREAGGCKLLKSKGRKIIEVPVDRVLE